MFGAGRLVFSVIITGVAVDLLDNVGNIRFEGVFALVRTGVEIHRREIGTNRGIHVSVRGV